MRSLRLRLLPVFALGFGVTALAASAMGCSGSDAASASDEVVSIPHTDPKNQAIGNCWLYATGSWVESLHLAATGETLDLSESYWSYWDWYLSLLWSADDEKPLTELSTGGFFTESAHILRHFGAMREGDFIPEESEAARSSRQSSALSAINKSLKEGALKDPAARKDMDLLRRELDAAWKLSPEMIERLDLAFGRTLDRRPENSDANVHKILVASKLPVLHVDGATHEKREAVLADLLPSTRANTPAGKYAWQQVKYPENDAERRAFLVRAQKALHDGLPPLVTFNVDFAAMKGSAFADVPASPGRQGGHMVVMSDYEIDDVPGFGLLKAGVTETRPEALEAALSPEAKMVFLRVKNSWGGTGAGDEFKVSGHYDLYMKYLNGPISWCLQPDGSTNRNACTDVAALKALVFPAGY